MIIEKGDPLDFSCAKVFFGTSMKWTQLIYYINSAVCLSVCPGVDIGFRTSTNGQDLDRRTGSGPEIEVQVLKPRFETEVLKLGCTDGQDLDGRTGSGPEIEVQVLKPRSWNQGVQTDRVFFFFALNCRRRCCRKLPPTRTGFFFFFFFPRRAGLFRRSFDKNEAGHRFLGFLGNGFGVKEKKKAGTDGLCPTVTGTH